MTVVENAKMSICTCCWEFHHEYMKGCPFNYARKAAITECRLCQQPMCTDCKMSSQKELQGDVLSVYGLTICQHCMIQVWRLTTWHKDYEAIVSKKLEAFKADIRKEIYTLTQAKHAISAGHL